MSEPKEEMKRATIWAMDWCVDCPYCNDTEEGLDEIFGPGKEHECPACGKTFYMEAPK